MTKEQNDRIIELKTIESTQRALTQEEFIELANLRAAAIVERRDISGEQESVELESIGFRQWQEKYENLDRKVAAMCVKGEPKPEVMILIEGDPQNNTEFHDLDNVAVAINILEVAFMDNPQQKHMIERIRSKYRVDKLRSQDILSDADSEELYDAQEAEEQDRVEDDEVQELIASVQFLCDRCHGDAKAAGWWTDRTTGESLIGKRNVPEMLMLIVSEVAEAMEGYRKDKYDDHIPSRKMLEVELADAMIRIADLAGGLDLDLPGAIAEKLDYNRLRADHKLENRRKDGGKAF